ncbi:hypothetical protein SNOG_00003 [Parastagonospora nodorum SN15]|uniref:Uncharacterized protein n=1 Tax=Phaeosphaeria nodorum (strain SN15 / ATCC MYA-4574 / FGSC 10173) TaxID=321614 RepID=Q0V7L1_PHANO|nr:hypothetical protein SNOG_00003 [Parastagonospora nodorum SN15]EAT91498.1 hypothetical protein SNOG_00003 [Parastagonospora nodorum SN15]
MDTEYKCGKNEYTGKEIYLAAQRRVNLQKIAETLGSTLTTSRREGNSSFLPNILARWRKPARGFGTE